MDKILVKLSLILIFIAICFYSCKDTFDAKPKIINIGRGWANNSINAVIFRSNSLVTFKDYQVAAFYDGTGNVILAKRKSGSEKWSIRKTKFKGDVTDAHKCISIMIDGDGYLHMSWNQHNNALHYCRSKNPDGLELSEKIPMTGINEQNVTYPQFFKFPDGNLIFLYRDGSSGNGNLVINYYETENKTWKNLHRNLIDGEEERNSYWQTTIDNRGTIHISWVWRETPDVATNHDICYAKSTDGGKSWIKSNGENYILPITAESAEYIARISQNHELINQTSMCTDNEGNPYIAGYWTPEGSNTPQYHLVYYEETKWKIKQISERTTSFSLSGEGTKRIPLSRPQILVDNNRVEYLIFRDSERSNRVSVSICKNLEKNNWIVRDLTSFPVGMWEPTYDTELWKNKKKLDLFVQNVGQGDAEALERLSPQKVSILEWYPDY